MNLYFAPKYPFSAQFVYNFSRIFKHASSAFSLATTLVMPLLNLKTAKSDTKCGNLAKIRDILNAVWEMLTSIYKVVLITQLNIKILILLLSSITYS